MREGGGRGGVCFRIAPNVTVRDGEVANLVDGMTQLVNAGGREAH